MVSNKELSYTAKRLCSDSFAVITSGFGMLRRIATRASVAALVLAASSLTITSCTGSEKVDQTPTVIVTNPELLGLASQTLELPATVKEASTVKAAFKSAGELLSVSVKEGDYVNKGQLIATLDDVDYKLGVEAARSQYEQFQKEMARITQLHERGSISDNEYDKAKAGLEQLKVQLTGKQHQVDYTRLYAPVSGYVQNVFSHKGEMVDAGTPVLTIMDVTQMQVEVNLPQSVYAQRQALRNPVAKINGETYPLKVSGIVPKADGTQMYRMLLDLPKEKALAHCSGANVEVEFQINSDLASASDPSASSDVASEGDSSVKGGLLIPMSSIAYDDVQPYVWVLKENTDNTSCYVTRQDITILGTTPEGEVIVGHGLNPDTKIVRAGVKHLHQDERVKVLPQKSPSNKGGLL